jgi:hypothetical protein
MFALDCGSLGAPTGPFRLAKIRLKFFFFSCCISSLIRSFFFHILVHDFALFEPWTFVAGRFSHISHAGDIGIAPAYVYIVVWVDDFCGFVDVFWGCWYFSAVDY